MAGVTINIKDIKDYIGREIGTSKWVEITQSRVTKFAEATGDFQWVHVDAEQARTELATGRTIVHNYFLLSLMPKFFDQVVTFTGLEYGLNRGAENIRFLKPLPTGSKVRIRLKLSGLQEAANGGWLANFHILMESEDGPILKMALILLLVAAENTVQKTNVHPLSTDQHQGAAIGL